MTELASTDYTAQRIYLHADTMSSGISIALYKEIYDEKIATTSKQAWSYLACDAEGYAPKTSTKKTPRRLLLPTGWKIVPYDSSHTLALNIEIVNVSDSLENIGCFDRSSLSSGTDVDIDTAGISQVEVVTISLGSSVPIDKLDQTLAAAQTASSNSLQAVTDIGGVDTKIDGLVSSVDAIDVIVDAILIDTSTDIPALITAIQTLSTADVQGVIDGAGLSTAASVTALSALVTLVKDKTDLLPADIEDALNKARAGAAGRVAIEAGTNAEIFYLPDGTTPAFKTSTADDGTRTIEQT